MVVVKKNSMDINEIQFMKNRADAYKEHLESCGCTDVDVNLIPDDRIMEGTFRLIYPIKMVKCNVTINRSI